MRCPRCGSETQPSKMWHLTSPIPDSEGRVVITIMGSFKCPNCGHSWRGRVNVLRVGGGHDVEFGSEGGQSRRYKESRTSKREGGKVIEVDISDILSEEE